MGTSPCINSSTCQTERSPHPLRKSRYVVCLAILLGLMVLAACTQDEPKESSKEKATAEKADESKDIKPDKGEKDDPYVYIMKAPEAPETLQEVSHYPEGELAHLKFRDENDQPIILKEIDKLPELDGSEGEDVYEAFWNKLVELYAMEYKDPKELWEQLKVKSFGSPDIDDPRYQFKDGLNVEIILDASGSMKADVNGKSKMDLAKEAIRSFAKTLPEDANIALRVYGHKGSGSDEDKELSCKANEKVYGFSGYDESKMNSAIDKIEPKGWTSVADSLDQAQKDLSAFPADQNTNIIYLVSDGIETCDGDPLAAAKSLKDSDVQPIVNVIGFDVDAAGQKQLKDVATSAEGSYANVYNQDELTSEFDRAKEVAEKWEQWKQKALGENFSEKVSYGFDILGFSARWGLDNLKENNNLTATLLYLRDNDRLTGDAYEFISNKNDERRRNILDMQSQFEEDMKKVNEENYEKMNEMINEKYNSNKE